MGRRLRGGALAVVLAFLLAGTTLGAAEHYGTNSLVFAPIAESSTSRARGFGVVEYKGGSEPRSKWTATFQFDDLPADTTYTVVVQGRFGDDGSVDAYAFSELCWFHSDAAGEGGCWSYFRGLRRLDVVQLRAGDEQGRPVLQATRSDDGPGSITAVPNRYTPAAGANARGRARAERSA